MVCNTAMILAAGLGTRMRPLTESMPKPLVSVNGRPLIEYALDTLREADIRRVVINTHYLAEQMQRYIQSITDIQVTESYEADVLETGGGIANALPLLGSEPFFALNSDTICLSKNEATLKRMQSAWDSATMDMLMLLMPVERAVGYDGQGDFCLDVNSKRFRRRNGDEKAELVFTGVQLLKPTLFTDCPEGPFSMNVLYNQRQSEGGWFERIGFVIHDGDWLHVGDPEGVRQAEAYFAHSASHT